MAKKFMKNNNNERGIRRGGGGEGMGGDPCGRPGAGEIHAGGQAQGPHSSSTQPLAPTDTHPESPQQEVPSVPVVIPGVAEARSDSFTISREEIPITEVEAPASERTHIVKSAGLISLGNFGSSIMGMVRQIVIGALGTAIAGPFNAALASVQKFNDLLINGSVNGALIPTFNDYAAPEKRDELRRLVFTMVNLVILIMLTTALLFVFIAPWFLDSVLHLGFGQQGNELTIQYARIVFFSLIVLGPFAVLQAALFARKEFGWPSVATAAYHIGIILGAIVGGIIGEQHFGQYGIAIGVLFGAFGEIGLLLPGLYRQKLRYMFVLDLKHPALRRILKLYAPLAFSFFMSGIFGFLDLSLASNTPGPGTPKDNYTAMVQATTLIQFAGGLVATALSVAVLPTLTEHVREKNTEAFKQTLLMGIRLGMLLMIPAMAGLIVLRFPITALIFEHGGYGSLNAQLDAIALQNYAYQLPFLALDQLLISAFYARKNTFIPVAVLFVGLVGYLLVALPFYRTIGMPALAFANAVQNSVHGIVLFFILRFIIGPFHIRQAIPAILKICVSAAVMVAVAWGLQLLLGHIGIFSLDHFTGRLLTVLVAGGIAAAVFIGGVLLLKVEEVGLVKTAVMAKLGRK